MGNLINWVFLTLSEAVFKAVSGIYSLFYGLATARLFRADTIQDVSNRIYILVSVVILFAFSVKLIEAIVNPDLLTDAKKGVTGVLKRTIIGLLLIVAIPNIFNFVYYLQAEIIVGGLVEKVVLGYVDTDSESGVEGAGGELTSAIITSFVVPIDVNGVPYTESGLCGGDANCNYADKLLDANDAYENYVSFLGGNPNYDKLNEIKGDVVWEKGKPIYDINGLALLAVGLFILYQIIILCFDAGLRLVELGLLEIIAPVVIVSYIAAGSDHLSKWAKMTVEKFTSILIRIAGLCFMVLGFRLMNDKNSIFNNDSVSFWFKVFLIIGLLRMVKELPDIFGALFGAKIKMGGIKDKLGEMAGIGKMAQNAWSGIGGIAKASPQLLAAAGRGIGRGVGKLDNKIENKFGKSLGSGIRGLKDKASDKLNENEKFNKVRGIAGKVGGAVKGAASYAGRAGKVVGAAYKSQGKDAKGAVNKALDENFRAERYEEQKAQEKKQKAKISQAIASASKSQLVFDKDKLKIDFEATATNMLKSGNGITNAKNANAEAIKNMQGLSTASREMLKDNNEKMAAFSEAQRKSDLQKDMLNQVSTLKGISKNVDQASNLTTFMENIQAGNFADADAMNNALKNILDANNYSDKKGLVGAGAVDQYSKMFANAVSQATNEGGIIGTSQLTLDNNLKDADDDLKKSKSDIEDMKKEMKGTALDIFSNMASTIEKTQSAVTSEQRNADSRNLYDNVQFTPQSSGNNSSGNTSSSDSSSSSGPAPQPAPQAAPAGSAQAGSTNVSGGTVQANIDTSGIEKKLDAINDSVQTGSKNITDQVRTSGESINGSIKSGNETLNDIKTNVNKSRETLENIDKTTKNMNDNINDKEE